MIHVPSRLAVEVDASGVDSTAGSVAGGAGVAGAIAGWLVGVAGEVVTVEAGVAGAVSYKAAEVLVGVRWMDSTADSIVAAGGAVSRKN
jgi:hypothetical protein